MEIIFIRHPATDANEQKKYLGNTDAVLNQRGEKHIKLIARFLKNKKISAVYSSSLERAFRTAQAIAKEHSLNVTKEKGLDEFNFGVWEGKTFEEIQKEYPSEAKDFLFNPLKLKVTKGESFSSFKKRVEKALAGILEKETGTIVIVSHGGVNRIIICSLLGLPFTHYWQMKQDLGAINIIERIKGFSTISLLNFKPWEK
jgi:alpha-ribazole phosphatase